ncbi:hypothetical protein ACLI09_09515 [Flavobacterium sp. RHBU_24]|uniref:hypothetical protein n=1 Tax=Flavobacterium sp. RHBU_24 TaxID=3391185 RepID=UPI003984D088
MDAKTTLVLLYQDGTQNPHADCSVLELVRGPESRSFSENAPLAILRPDIGLHILYDAYRLGMYRQGLDTFDEVLEELSFEALYRNELLLKDDRGNEADPGSLWKLRSGTLILVGDDAHLTIDFANAEPLFNRIA